MKILFTGGGSGGHFYPIIAVAEEINEIVKEERLLRPELFYMSTDPYNEGLLFENNIMFEAVSAGKIRKQKSISNIFLNFIDLWKTGFGVMWAVWRMFIIYPDVVFSKGGYASFPALFAARVLRIPVVMHESDSSPGKVSSWSSKFAKKIAVSYPEAAKFFKEDRTAYTGNPVRKEVRDVLTTEAYELLGLDSSLKTVLVIGGSQGSKFINEVIMDALPELLSKYQVVHQTGKNNFKIMQETRDVVLLNNPNKNRYKMFDYLNVLNTRASAGVADIIVSRAGSAIFEVALWGKPSIIVPIPEPTSHDQRSNAYSYARSGSAIVIEEKNLAGGVLVSEINRIIDNPNEYNKMVESAKSFARADSARLIAVEILRIAVGHDK